MIKNKLKGTEGLNNDQFKEVIKK